MGQAQAYLKSSDDHKDQLKQLKESVSRAELAVKNADAKSTVDANKKLKDAQRRLREETRRQKDAQQDRYQLAFKVCKEILTMSEGQDAQETQVNSARFLGTLFLISPGEGRKLAKLHQTLKPFYKGVLALRLLDKLLQDGHVTHPYIKAHIEDSPRYSEKQGEITAFQEKVCIPILLGALFQDAGLLHPDALSILKGPGGDLDEFRVLTKEERIKLLKINYEHTLKYVTNGIGSVAYVGNSHEEKAAFDKEHKERLVFLRSLINDAIKPKQGLGNLLKVPQIYSSVILGTKKRYTLHDLPKAALLVEKVASEKGVSEVAAKSLINITGYFPQGFGIAYIPRDERIQDLDRYEYAIVNRLYPENPSIPECRTVTRNLTFNSYGQNLHITKEFNLYYPAARKKLERLPESRLKEIIRTLYSNLDQNAEQELLPRFWHPYSFFSFKAFQNLWNKSTATTN